MAMQQPPPQQPEAGQDDQQQEDSGSVQQLVEDIYSDLMKFQQMVSQAAPPLAEKLQAITEGFKQVVQELIKGGGGAEQPPQPEQQGPKGPSAGGPGAVPM